MIMVDGIICVLKTTTGELEFEEFVAMNNDRRFGKWSAVRHLIYVRVVFHLYYGTLNYSFVCILDYGRCNYFFTDDELEFKEFVAMNNNRQFKM